MFTFQVKQKDRSNILSVFHILISLILLLDISHVHETGRRDWLFSIAYGGACLFLIAVGIARRKILRDPLQHLPVLLFESALIFSGAIYFWAKGISLVAFSHGALAGAIVLFWIYVKRKLSGEVIVVSEKHIIVPGLAGDRVVAWSELSNVIKKYDLLTIDFRNNKLLQAELEGDTDIDDAAFNSFCREQIAVSQTTPPSST